MLSNKFKKLSYWIIIPLILFAILICAITILDTLHLINGFEEKNESLQNLHASGLVILTVILIIVACVQLNNIGHTSKGDFLLRMDERYCNKEIIQARIIIHKIFCTITPKDTCTETYKIAEKIIDMEEQQACANDFIYLLNFLDFLETISYFCNKNYLSVKEVDELMGHSLVYYYKVFELLICHRRKKYHKPDYYSEIEKLVDKIKSEQSKPITQTIFKK